MESTNVFRVTVMEGQGYGGEFASLDLALIYASQIANEIDDDDGRRMECDGIVCENDSTGESWVLVDDNGHRWEAEERDELTAIDAAIYANGGRLM